jgi:outer membrane lipoprotein-sorting protein
MSAAFFADRPNRRWLVPGVVAAVIAGGAAVVARPAVAEAGLPDRTAADLIADVQKTQVTSFSGTVVQSADLGLPALPTKAAAGDLASTEGLLALGTGSHTWRVWSAGPTASRLALVTELGESDVIRNGPDVWLWSSRDKKAVHYRLPAEATAKSHPTPPALPSGVTMPATPDEAAKLALAKLDPSTEVSTGGTATVAGRSAYELVLTPRDRAALVSSVHIAIDGEKRVPLRVQVFGSKAANPSKAAIDVGFTAVDFGTPDARQFTFTPPPDTTVTEASLEQAAQHPDGAAKRAPAATNSASANPAAARPRIVGTGWTSVVTGTMPAPAATGQSSVGTPDGRGGTGDKGAAADQLQSLMATLPEVSGSWGSGRLLETNLLCAVITSDGRYAVGAVAPSKLYEALSSR